LLRIREYPCLMRAGIIHLFRNGLLCRKDEKKFLQLSHGRLLREWRVFAFYGQIIRLFRNFNDVNNYFLVARPPPLPTSALDREIIIS